VKDEIYKNEISGPAKFGYLKQQKYGIMVNKKREGEDGYGGE